MALVKGRESVDSQRSGKVPSLSKANTCGPKDVDLVFFFHSFDYDGPVEITTQLEEKFVIVIGPVVEKNTVGERFVDLQDVYVKTSQKNQAGFV